MYTLDCGRLGATNVFLKSGHLQSYRKKIKASVKNNFLKDQPASIFILKNIVL